MTGASQCAEREILEFSFLEIENLSYRPLWYHCKHQFPPILLTYEVHVLSKCVALHVVDFAKHHWPYKHLKMSEGQLLTS